MSSHSADTPRGESGPDGRPNPSLDGDAPVTHFPGSDLVSAEATDAADGAAMRAEPDFDTDAGTRVRSRADADAGADADADSDADSDADADANADVRGAAGLFAEPQAECERESPAAARASLRAMWQLPAAWRVLQLLTVPLASAPPPARVFEDALVDPIAHMSAVADMHGRLLGHGLGRACMDKWMGSACRFFREFPGTFCAILGDNGDDVRVFRDWGDYARLDARTRLLCLYAMAEMVICEHDTLLKVTAGLAEVGHEEMRLEAVGFDAVGNAYWYFGDEDRLYREPGKRKARGKGRAEAKVESKAFRSPARSTRALVGKEEDVLNGDGGNIKDEEVLEDEGQLVQKTKSRRRSSPATAEVAAVVERRSSSRKRNPPPPLVIAEASPKRAKRPRRTGPVEPEEFSDADLRCCYAWELVCEGAEELEALIARFGPCADITNARESFLAQRLQEELLPILQETHVKAKRVEEKRRQVEYNATNLKKSSRVEAMERRKREEDEAAARKEEEEAVLEREREARRVMVNERVKSIEREVVRELRAARGDVAKSKGGTAAFAWDAPRISRADRGRVRSLRQRGVGAHGGCASDEKAVLGSAEENVVGSDKGTRVKSSSSALEVVTSTGVGGDGEAAKNEEAFGELKKAEGREGGSFEKEGEDVAMAEAESETEAKAKEQKPVASIPSAISEVSIPGELTWQHLPDEVVPDRLLPARFLTRFVLFRRDDMTHAALEDVLVDSVDAEGQDTKPNIMGFGIVVPPDGSESDPVCVELGRVVEWQIEYIRDDSILWLKTELGWYQLETTEPLPEYASTFSSGRSKFEICVRLSILGGLMKAGQLTYEDACGLLAQRYLDMRVNKEADILESSTFITEQLAMMKKQTLLKSGFYLTLKKRESDRRRAAKRAAEKEQHEVELFESRKRKRESDKRREEEHAEKLAAGRMEKAAMAKLKRERSSSVGRQSTSPVPRYHPPYRPTFHPPLALGATSPAAAASLPSVPGIGLSDVADGSSGKAGGDDMNVRSSAAPLALSGSLDRSASIVTAGVSPFVPEPRPVSPIDQDSPELSTGAVSVVARQMQTGREEQNSASHALGDVQVPNCDWGGRYSSSAQEFDRSNVTAPTKSGTPQASTAPLAASNGSLNRAGETLAMGSESHPQTDHAPVYVSSPKPDYSNLGVGKGNDLSAPVENVRSPRDLLPSPPAVEPRSEPEGCAAPVAISSAHLSAKPAVAYAVLQMGAADSLVGYSAKENGTATSPACLIPNGPLPVAPNVTDAELLVGAADSDVGASAKENGVDADLPGAFSGGRLPTAPIVADADLQVGVTDPLVGFSARESSTAAVNGLAPAGSE